MKAFDCRRCGQCCYGEGGIVLEEEEIEKIARHLQLPLEDFLSRFCEKRHGRLSIKTGPDGFCIFFDQDKGCLIHPVKPKICTLWPFFPANVRDKDNWELAKEACPGINPECPFEEFVRQAPPSAHPETPKKKAGK